MKKTFLFSLLFSLYISNVWGTTWKKGGVKIVSSSTTLTISAIDPEGAGTRGVMDDYEDFDNGSLSSSVRRPATWSFSFTDIVIEEGVTTIGAHAFQSCTTIKNIKVPTSLTSFRSDAFKGCSGMEKIYYAGSPNQWAVIDFANQTAHPFGALSGSASYYFYGITTSATTTLAFFPPLTEIKPYTFQRCSIPSGLAIPGTVATIGNQAFYGIACPQSSGEITINRKNAPTIGYAAFEGLSTNRNLHVPTDATDYPTSSGATTEIKYDWYFTLVTHNTSGNTLGGKGADVTWDLDENGILTLDASSPSASKILEIDAANSTDMPWYRFRRLVHKIVIKGEVTALNNLLHYHYGISEVYLSQATIPTHSATYIAGTSYNYLFNKTDKLVLRVRNASLGDAELSKTPWNDATHWTIAEIETATIAEDSDNSDVLNDLSTKPSNAIFDVQLSRTLRNVSFNSFCSPVDMSAAEVTAIFGEGTEIYTLASSSYDPIANELALNLSENQTAIEAGKPYVIKPANDAPTITLTDVAPSTVATAAQTIETDVMDFHGLLNPYTLSSGDKFLVVSANNELNWTESGTLKGMRSYFTLKPGVPAQAMAAKARLVFADESPEAITNIEVEQPVQKIMRNGQLLIVRDGVTYNTMGQIVE